MGEQAAKRKNGRRRIVIVTVALSLLAAMALPLSGYVIHGIGQAWAADEKEQAADPAAVNQRAEYWRAVRQGVEGYTSVQGQETSVLIQNGGENWRSIRNGPVSFYGAVSILGVLAMIVLFHLTVGGAKLDKRSGRMISRWSAFERINHWLVAVLFIILAITGLSLLFGRAVLIPVLGKEGFAAWAGVAKLLHDYLSLPFIATLLLMLVPWIPKHMIKKHDLTWLRMGGGYLTKTHPPADFVNAGEKVWFWLLMFGSIGLTGSGVYLLFPNMGWERDAMQLANVVHSATAMFVIAFSLGHIYLGTLGSEGSLEGMIGGSVDEEWAQQHHNLWYAEVTGKTPRTQPADRAAPPDASTAAPT